MFCCSPKAREIPASISFCLSKKELFICQFKFSKLTIKWNVKDTLFASETRSSRKFSFPVTRKLFSEVFEKLSFFSKAEQFKLKMSGLNPEYVPAVKFVVNHMKQRVQMNTEMLSEMKIDDCIFDSIHRDVIQITHSTLTTSKWGRRRIKFQEQLLHYIKENASGELVLCKLCFASQTSDLKAKWFRLFPLHSFFFAYYAVTILVDISIIR